MSDTTGPVHVPQPHVPCPACGAVPELIEWRADTGAVLEERHEPGCPYGSTVVQEQHNPIWEQVDSAQEPRTPRVSRALGGESFDGR